MWPIIVLTRNLGYPDGFEWFKVSLIFITITTTLIDSSKLEEISSNYESLENVNKRDSVLINFPSRKNGTKKSRELYLPPDEEEDSYFLPEVIDNRVRLSTGIYRPILPAASPLSVISLPEVELRTPSITSDQSIKQNFYRHNFGQYKNAPLTSGVTGTSGISQVVTTPKDPSNFYVQVNSMSCQNSGQEPFFRSSMKGPRNSEFPVIDGVSADNCRIERNNDAFKIDFSNERFWNCGVHDCSNERERYYCLDIRFPAVTGLRLKEDQKVTLRCKTQDKTASHTRRLNIKTLDTSGRNSPKIETGGYKNIFETEVGLYRKTFGSGHLFDAKIEPGGTVVLGEEVLLRALVRAGDGWRYSRISDVTVHYVEKKQRSKIMNSLWILDANGCLNPDVREICSREQYKVTPLENYLMFEAFMFDNMKETDEMVMNVRITGCLDGADCALNCPAGHSRRARSLGETSRNETMDSSNDITFRVVLQDDDDKAARISSNSFNAHLALPYILSVFVLVAIVAMLATIKIFKRQSVAKI